jgi:hypothetical protein
MKKTTTATFEKESKLNDKVQKLESEKHETSSFLCSCPLWSPILECVCNLCMSISFCYFHLCMCMVI